jgi:hypothetical protein
MPAPEKTATGQPLSDCASRPSPEAARPSFTRGPWRVGARNAAGYIEVVHGVRGAGAPHAVVARVTARLTWLPQQRATARLIAAAPSLYSEADAAVREMREVADRLGERGLADLADDLRIASNDLNGALKRARGE